MSKCLNCCQETSGDYCAHCGQKNSIVRLNWKTLLHELNDRIFGLDNKYFRNIRDLSVRPQEVINNFIKGNRVKYMGPVSYYLVNLTLFVLIASVLKVDLVIMHHGTQEFFTPSTPDSSQIETGKKVSKLMFENFRLIAFLAIPIYTLFNSLLFKKSRLNILEHASVVIYSHAHPIIISFFAIVIYYLSGTSYQTFIVTVVYSGFVAAKFYDGNKIWNFLKGMLSILLGIVGFSVILVLVLFLIFKIFPDFIQSL